MKMRKFARCKGYEFVNLPSRKTVNSAGYDFESAEDVIIESGCCAIVKTGIKAYMGDNEYLGISLRSSISINYGLMMINSQGIIDADYVDNCNNEGNIGVPIINVSKTRYTVHKGDRIAQGIFYNFLKTDDDYLQLKETRVGGVGSTGK